MNVEFIDLFENFKLHYHHRLTVESLLDGWYHAMNVAPTLKELCIQDYQSSDHSWETIAKERVFSRTHQDYVKMTRVHQRLKSLVSLMKPSFKAFYDELPHIRIVLYHGLGNGAGWATHYHDVPAILLGIEKIAELDWISDEELKRLMAHEYVHLVHQHLRQDAWLFKSSYEEAVMRLYLEGLASYYEMILAEVPIRVTRWEQRCKMVEGKLKANYRQVLAQEGKDFNAFYGDWHQVEGLSDTGYYLGKQLIATQLEHQTFHTIAQASFKTIESWVHAYLASE